MIIQLLFSLSFLRSGRVPLQKALTLHNLLCLSADDCWAYFLLKVQTTRFPRIFVGALWVFVKSTLHILSKLKKFNILQDLQIFCIS